VARGQDPEARLGGLKRARIQHRPPAQSWEIMSVVPVLLVVPLLLGPVTDPEPRDPGAVAPSVPVWHGEGVDRRPSPAPSCDLPLRWRVAEVDSRFGLSREGAEEAVRRAAILWEDASRRRLFVHDPEDGFPIRFVFDHRQQLAAALSQGAEALQVTLDQLERWQSDLGVERIDLEQRREDYAGRLRSLDRQVASHNRLVQSWNEQGGAPPEEARRLAEIGDRFEEERRALNRMAQELNERQSALARETESWNEAVRNYNRGVEDLQASASTQPVESGTYREETTTRDGAVVEIQREIRIFQFTNREHLLLVLAHELGHALGLEHSIAAGAVMSPRASLRDHGGGIPSIHPTDLNQLRRVCPPR
jgi:hypothetical protein